VNGILLNQAKEVEMSLYPPFALSFVNGFLLIIPLLVFRYGIPKFFGVKAQYSLDNFPPLKGRERVAQNIYLVTTTYLVFSPLFAGLTFNKTRAAVGGVCYLVGIIVLAVGLYTFSASASELVQSGIYRITRNPIYSGYFLVFAGISLLIGSWFHLAVTLLYQYSVHLLVLSEERWCAIAFCQEYDEYLQKVPRYL
jgi:protein-S-isoprenylcysteine O-methyltransferase Ste14